MWKHTVYFRFLANKAAQNTYKKGGISALDSIIYISMETGMDPITLVNLPITVLKRIDNGISNIYKEKNRIQEEYIKDRRARGE